jgi:hypothetical protein
MEDTTGSRGLQEAPAGDRKRKELGCFFLATVLPGTAVLVIAVPLTHTASCYHSAMTLFTDSGYPVPSSDSSSLGWYWLSPMLDPRCPTPRVGFLNAHVQVNRAFIKISLNNTVEPTFGFMPRA